MDTFLKDFLTDMLGRFDGPLQFRLYIQPLMAIALAVRDGLADAREGRGPYGWSLATDKVHRAYLLREGWKSIFRVFVLAYVLDLAYQYIVLHGWRPLQAFSAAVLLALIPYLLLRGPVSRLAAGRNARHDR